MPEHHSKKKFLKLPKYPGSSEAFRDFIAQNLRYPKEALEKRVEGTVIVAYDITDNGTVENAHVTKGIGSGCDEEAVRVVSLLRFEKVSNRGMRVKVSTKTKIRFRLPEVSINYTYSQPQAKEKKDPQKDNKGGTVYNYTLKF